jgi:hypothetical protein
MENQSEHLLDGTSMTYNYENGSGVEVKFDRGKFHFKWLSGPFKDLEGAEDYKSRKLGDKIYVVNFLMANKTFVTIVFNFNTKTMCTSALFTPCTEEEMVLFEGGIIKHLELLEN